MRWRMGWWRVFHGIGGEEREVEGNRVLLPREEVK